MAPKKPIRHSPLLERKMADVETEQNEEEEEEEVEVDVEVQSEPNTMYMNLNAEGEVDTANGKVEEPAGEGEKEDEKGPPRETAVDRRTSRRQKREREKLEKDREKQEERERKEREKKEEKERKLSEKSKSKSPPPVDSQSPILFPRERVKASPTEDAKFTNGADKERDESTQGASVVMTKPPNKITACGEQIDTMFDTTNAGEGELTAVCKGTKVVAVETNVVEESPGKYRIQFTPEMADMYMLRVRWRGSDIAGSPFLINLNLLAPAQNSEKDNKENGQDGENDAPVKEQLTEPSKENGDREGEGEGDREGEGERKGEGAGVGEREGEAVKEKDKNLKPNVTENGASQEQAEHTPRDIREMSPQIVVSVSDDPFDMAYEARRLLGTCIKICF